MDSKTKNINTPEELYKFLNEQNDRIGLAEEWIIYLEAKVKQLDDTIAKKSPYKSANAVSDKRLTESPPPGMIKFYKNEHSKE